jgi:hypothetical protein
MAKELGLHNNKENLFGDNAFDVYAVYTNHAEKPEHLRFSEFDKKEWSLDDSTIMTPKDIDIMERYKRGFLDFLELCVILIKGDNNNHEVCEEEWIRMKEAMTID